MNALLDAVLQILAAGVLALGGYAIQRFASWLKLREDSEVRAYLNVALERAVDLALAEVRSSMAPRVLPMGPVSDATVEKAVEYARDRVPDALARFRISEVDLADMLRARLATRQYEFLASLRAAG